MQHSVNTLLIQLQEAPQKAPSLRMIYQLVELLEQSPKEFSESLQNCYLKIFKQMLSQPKKSVQKFQKLIQRLFNFIAQGSQRKKKPLARDCIITLLQTLIILFGRGMYSPENSIKVFSGRLMFMVIKPLSHDYFVQINIQSLDHLNHGILSLLPQNKQLFIKLASVVQEFLPELKDQMIGMARSQESDGLRKLAVLNVESTHPVVLQRLRDRHKQIRIICIKKLRKASYKLQGNLGVKILYEAVMGRQSDVKSEMIAYVNESLKGNLQQSLQFFLEELNFRQMLIYPHLEQLFNMVLSQIILIRNFQQVQQVVQRLCLKVGKRKNQHQISNSTLFIYQVFNNLVYSKKLVGNHPIEENFMTGFEIAALIQQQSDLFGLYQALLFAKRPINLQETGRERIRQRLMCCLSQLKPVKEKCVLKQECNDIVYQVNQNLLQQQIVYCKKQVIFKSLHLINLIVQLLTNYGQDEQNIQFLVQLAQSTRLKVVGDQQLGLNSQISLNEKMLKESQGQVCKQIQAKLQQSKTQKRWLVELYMLIFRAIYLHLRKTHHPDFLFLAANVQSTQRPLLRHLEGLSILRDSSQCKAKLHQFCRELLCGYHSLQLGAEMQVCSDMIMRHDLLRSQQIQTQNFNADIFGNKLYKLMFADNLRLRNLAIEVVCKLLFNDKLPNHQSFMMTLLLLLWDTRINQQNSKAIQMLTIFFRKFPQQGQLSADLLERCIQIFFQLLEFMSKNRSSFNRKFISYNFNKQEFQSRCLLISLNLMAPFKNQRYRLIMFILATCRYTHFLQKNINLIGQIPTQHMLQLRDLLTLNQRALNLKKSFKQKLVKEIKKLQTLPEGLRQLRVLDSLPDRRRNAKQLFKNLQLLGMVQGGREEDSMDQDSQRLQVLSISDDSHQRKKFR